MQPEKTYNLDRLGNRFSAFIALLLLLTGVGIWATLTSYANQQRLQDRDTLQTLRGSNAVKTLEMQMAQAQATVVSLANLSQSLYQQPQALKKTIPIILSDAHQSKLIAGGGVWSAPYAFDAEQERLAFFYGQQAERGMAEFEQYNDPEQPSYTQEEWYRPLTKMAKGSTLWSSVYRDPYTQQPMVTVSSPIWLRDKFLGVVTLDLALQGVNALVRRISEQQPGYLFLVDQQQRILAHPYLEERLDQPIEQLADLGELAEFAPEFAPLLTLSYDPSQPQILLAQSQLLGDPILDQPVNVKIFNVVESGWLLFLVSPTRTDEIGPHRTWPVVLMLLFIVGFGYVLLHQLVQRRMLSPLAALQRALQDDDNHDLNNLKDSASGPFDEIARLCVAQREVLRSSQLNLDAANLALQQQGQGMQHQAPDNSVPLALSMIKSSQSLMHIRDRENRFVLANPAYCQAVQRSQGHLLGKRYQQVFPEALASKAEQRLNRVLETQAPLSYRDQFIVKQKTENYLAQMYPLYDNAGTVTGVGYVAVNISQLSDELSQAEQSLETTQHELMNLQHNQQTSQKEQIQTNQALQHSEHRGIQLKAAGVFVERLDQRLLGNLAQYTQLLRQRLIAVYSAVLPSQDKPMAWQKLDEVEVISTQSELLHLLFNALAHPISHKQMLPYFGNYLEVFYHSNAQNRWQIELDCDPQINSERPPLEWLRVIHTLLQNATQHGFNELSKQAQITVEVRQLERGVKVSVIDNGFGLPADFDIKIAQASYPNQSHSLVVLRAWLNSHGGELSWSSELNQGSRFEAVLFDNPQA
ncbi:PDC sensor domain-containing protein [Paraferrimonas sedimenticola]|uniref:Sensor histidine kinase n=1 Tax=Paraferrimonas sedimenticola TaxID=375674 RepID=A0AA37S075_9GAMM|nr:cache domain-containing protein [Paraferrimonas sedimenticola]GLP97892.1 sensor histidine kinase [Paraferrimonas sedimenticola]